MQSLISRACISAVERPSYKRDVGGSIPPGPTNYIMEKSMQILQEVTDWKDLSYRQPNHIYFVSRTKLIGYIKEGTVDIIQLRTPMPFTKSHRKFNKLTPTQLKKLLACSLK